jgi:hypothetical protein
MIASTATTAPSMPSESDCASGSTRAGSTATKLSSQWRAGHSNAAMIAPITASLTRQLMKFASACLENSRLSPAAGEILDSLGLSASAELVLHACYHQIGIRMISS